ncbi:low affinity iron permease family protein [Flavobacterium sp.]|uniref:low affinity iron permease family protein n=1 Tax=Flavobacterium sp. TaxID=239 RepID=UPI00286B5353|nr:low affinity iron permease family protein [Flavobacterium sp.]
MKNTYLSIEKQFEKLTLLSTAILGNSITFMLAFCLVLYWWINDIESKASVHQIIGDIIFGTTFLSLFIIQKSFNRYSALIHLKINELVSSHENANNAVINFESKSEREIKEILKEYTDIENETGENDASIDEDLSKKP